MSRVYGELFSDIGRSTRTRRGTKWMRAKVNTWNGSLHIYIQDNEKVSINVENLDVTINGCQMFRDRRKEEDIPMEDLLRLVEKRFKKESAKYARLPKKEFKRFKELMLVEKVIGQLKGD